LPVLHRQVGWLRSSEDFVHVGRGASIQFRSIGAIGQKGPGLQQPSRGADQNNSVLCCKVPDLLSVRDKIREPVTIRASARSRAAIPSKSPASRSSSDWSCTCKTGAAASRGTPHRPQDGYTRYPRSRSAAARGSAGLIAACSSKSHRR
jgi:hypothetical protein